MCLLRLMLGHQRRRGNYYLLFEGEKWDGKCAGVKWLCPQLPRKPGTEQGPVQPTTLVHSHCAFAMSEAFAVGGQGPD